MAEVPPACQEITVKPRWEKRLRSALILSAVCTLAVSLFILAYSKDNKYTSVQPHGSKGLLTLDSVALDQYPVIFLIAGWEYYGGELLAPEDFSANPRTPEYIYIGQYGGFDAGDKTAPPHGSATYRLNITVPGQAREYMLELPEIFSAYRAYVNGAEVMSMGNPDPASYLPETGNRSATFSAAGNVEIVIAASDFSHLYSGMTYPPAFGEPEHVSNLLGARLAVRAAACAVALTVALLSVLVGLLNRRGKLTLLYGLLCLCFVGYVSYPVLNAFLGGYQPFYVLEYTSFCGVLLLAMAVQYMICGQKDRWSRYFFCFGALCCTAAATLPFMSFFSSTAVMYGYSRLVSVYHYIAAGYLTFMAVRAIAKKNVSDLTMLGGILVFDCALVMDRLLPLYEPIYIGWFVEIASFTLIIAIGAAIGQEIAAKYRESAVLSERASSMERLSEMQQGYFAVLRQEMDETKAARHDLRHHFTVMKGFIAGRQYEELTDYVASWQGPIRTDGQEMVSESNVINMLVHHYTALCEQNRILFDIQCELTEPVRISDADMCGALSNLLENAVEACLRIDAGRRTIRFGLMNIGGDLVIRVENSTDGNVKQSGGAFLSSKGTGRTGYGLSSVCAIAGRYGGTATFSWDAEKRVFAGVVVL